MDPAGILILAEVTSKKEATWKTSGFSPPLQSRKYVQTIIPTPQKTRSFFSSVCRHSQTQLIFTPPRQSQPVYNYLRGMPFLDILLS